MDAVARRFHAPLAAVAAASTCSPEQEQTNPVETCGGGTFSRSWTWLVSEKRSHALLPRLTMSSDQALNALVVSYLEKAGYAKAAKKLAEEASVVCICLFSD